MEGTACREMVTAPLPPPEEGRVENPLFRFVFVRAVPKTSIKEQIGLDQEGGGPAGIFGRRFVP